MDNTKFNKIEPGSQIEKIQKFESYLISITILSFLFVAGLWGTGGLFVLLGILILVNFYIYTVYRRAGEGDEFWVRRSKPAIAGLLILSLLLLLEHFHIF